MLRTRDPPRGKEPPRHSSGGKKGGGKKKKRRRSPLWLPLAVVLGCMALIGCGVIYAVNYVSRIQESIRPESDAPSIVEEIQTLEEYKGDVVNILVCGIDYEEGRGYGADGSNDGMTDMILYCQFDIKNGALRMLQIPRNTLVTTENRTVTLSSGKTYRASNYQINSVALSNGGSIAALAEVIYDQYKLPVDYYVLDQYAGPSPKWWTTSAASRCISPTIWSTTAATWPRATATWTARRPSSLCATGTGKGTRTRTSTG